MAERYGLRPECTKRRLAVTALPGRKAEPTPERAQRSLRLAVNFGSEDFQQVVSNKNSSDLAVSAGRPGSEAALAKLAELLFVETVRRCVEGLPDGQTDGDLLRYPFRRWV